MGLYDPRQACQTLLLNPDSTPKDGRCLKMHPTANHSTIAEVSAPTMSGRCDWNALIACFLGWTLDAFDFFIVVMVLTEIGTTFGRSNADIALSLTVTLA